MDAKLIPILTANIKKEMLNRLKYIVVTTLNLDSCRVVHKLCQWVENQRYLQLTTVISKGRRIIFGNKIYILYIDDGGRNEQHFSGNSLRDALKNKMKDKIE